MKMDGVTEYVESMGVVLATTRGTHVSNDEPNRGAGRLVVRALNEAGYNSTEVDLLELIAWLKANRPELLRNEGGE